MKNREIKFRAWCSNKQEMYEPFTLERAINENNSLWHRGKDVFMQFTGLKDKNGKEIYEGDIVWPNGGWYNEKESYPFISGGSGIVEYRKGEFIVICPKYKEEKVAYLKDNVWDKKRNTGKKQNLFEIIGNIYENPELLKE